MVAIGVGAAAYLANRTYPVTINGVEFQLRGAHTLDSLVEEGYAQENPGDLLAIDGSVLTAGEGEAYSVTVNEEGETDFAREVQENDTVVYGRGLDKTEPATESTAAIPWVTLKEGGSGPIHAFFGKGVDGVITTTTGTMSGIVQETVTKEPENIVYKNYFPDVGEDKVIALTIDDGPWPETTEEILDILDQHEVKATFFTIGEQVDQSDYNKSLIKRMQDSGHQVSTHTYTHARGSGGAFNIGKLPDEERIQEVCRGQEANANATGVEANRAFRAPGGNFCDHSADVLRPYISAEIGWTVDTSDWRLPGANAIASAMTSATSGDIILCHDGGGDRTQTVEAFKAAIPVLLDMGYTFVTVDQMLAYPPVAPE